MFGKARCTNRDWGGWGWGRDGGWEMMEEDSKRYRQAREEKVGDGMRMRRRRCTDEGETLERRVQDITKRGNKC